MANPFIDEDPGELCIKAGDQEPSWLFRLRRGDANKSPVAIDTLVPADITIRIKRKGSTAAATVGIVSAILDDGTVPNRGLVRYDPTPTDVNTASNSGDILQIELVTDRAGIEATFPAAGCFTVNITARKA